MFWLCCNYLGDTYPLCLPRIHLLRQKISVIGFWILPGHLLEETWRDCWSCLMDTSCNKFLIKFLVLRLKRKYVILYQMGLEYVICDLWFVNAGKLANRLKKEGAKVRIFFSPPLHRWWKCLLYCSNLIHWFDNFRKIGKFQSFALLLGIVLIVGNTLLIT